MGSVQGALKDNCRSQTVRHSDTYFTRGAGGQRAYRDTSLEPKDTTASANVCE